MKLWRNVLMGILAMLTSFSFQVTAADSAAIESKPSFKEQKEAIYSHMKRYGINRDDMATMRRLYETAPPHSAPYLSILAKEVSKYGEHYRFELDNYVLTMVIPDAPYMQSWIVPYVETRKTDSVMEKELVRSKGAINIAHLGWYYGSGIWPLFVGWQGQMMVSMTYRILKPEEKENFSTPEKLRQLSSSIQRNLLPSQEKIEELNRGASIINHAGTRIYLDPEIVVINGRIWVRSAMNADDSRRYAYTTALSPDRMLGITFGMPKYDYNTHSDQATYPVALQKAFSDMEEMVASLRVAKVNDDGAPDPFVIERVELAPLPVREKLPSFQSKGSGSN